MREGWFVVLVACAYLGLLFAIAYHGDRRADRGRSIISTPYIYALSIAVYCTSWTFYGSVGRAASSGIDFLAIYLGPTLTFVLWWFLLRKVIRISKVHRITSIADFISSRYGKSTLLSGLVTVIAFIGIMPYISLQLKAISTSFQVLLHYPEAAVAGPSGWLAVALDTGLWVALALAAFSILFGTRHIDASERHEGMVAAIAFESIVKLVAFLSVGVFVAFALHGGVGDLFSEAAARTDVWRVFTIGGAADYGRWITLTLLSMAAIFCLPRQFHITVVENVDEAHLRKAVWLFPLYLFAINIFVLPIAVSGLLHFPDGTVDADTFVLTLPLAEGQDALALFAFIGGLSAATGMVIVTTIALSTMVCNDLVMPVLLRLTWLRLTERSDLTGLLLGIRRGSILVVLLLAYGYFRFIGESYALVTIGLLSFAAAAQFAPAILGGIFWKDATRKGALAGLSLGFLLWAYTLLLPSFARSGWITADFIEQGPFAVGLLKPYALFGLDGLDYLSHAVFWSLLFNVGGYVLVSLLTRQNAVERVQAALFVDVFRRTHEHGGPQYWRATATISDLRDLLIRFIGRGNTDRLFEDYARSRDLNLARLREADSRFVDFAERQLAGAIGAASARVMVASVVKREIVGIDEVMKMLDETSQVIEYSHRLEQKSRELEAATAELKAANERLKELDRLKDDFLSTISHELRTPLTSIRAFSEILMDNPELSLDERRRFLSIIVKESERLTRLINQVLDFAKLEAGRLEWEIADLDPKAVIEQAAAAASGLMSERNIRLEVDVPDALPRIRADEDRLVQVLLNLLSNGAHVCEPGKGRIAVAARMTDEGLLVSVTDNGPGIAPVDRERIFDRFQQAAGAFGDRPPGTGLGLPICRQIIEHFGGRIWVDSAPGRGAAFHFTVPYSEEAQAAK